MLYYSLYTAIAAIALGVHLIINWRQLAGWRKDKPRLGARECSRFLICLSVFFVSDILWAAANNAAACTSWGIHRDVTKSGKMIVHKVLDQYRRDDKLKAGMRELEDKFLAEFDAAREQARAMLREGQKHEAVKLLNDLYARHYAEADKLMTELDGEAAERTDP